MTPETINSAAIAASSVGHWVDRTERCRKIASPMPITSLGNDIHDHQSSPVAAFSTTKIAWLKNISAAYRMPAYRLLLDSEESASIDAAPTRASRKQNVVMAGNRKRLSRKNVKLPVKATCAISSTIAGSQVTIKRKVIRITSFPKTYSARPSGFDK